MDVTYNEPKFVEMVLYVAEALREDASGGATKLNKVLYFAEFAHMRRTGRPISGAEFRKLARGPAPRRLKPVRDRLVRMGEATIVQQDFLGYRMARLAPLRAADVSVFTREELSTIDEVLRELKALTAAQVSELSHQEPGWRLVDDGATIPYEAAFLGGAQVETPTTRALEAATARRLGLLPA